MAYTNFHMYFDDVEVGQEWESLGRTVTEADVANFAGISGDFNPIHVDHEFAKTTLFRKPVAHGALVLSMLTGLGLYSPPMRTMAFLVLKEWNFIEPVFVGDTIRLRTRIVNKTVRARGRYGVITWQRSAVNQEGKIVQQGLSETLVEGRANIQHQKSHHARTAGEPTTST